MLKSLLILPGGATLCSGSATENAIKSVTLTEMVNSGDELTIGSTCANMLEVTAITPGGDLSLTAGDEVTLYKVDDAGVRHKAGVFVLEKPTKPTANTMKLVGYDRIVKLDKDLTSWLKGLTGWPYPLRTFAKMVCEACGLTIIDKEIPNGSFLVYQFLTESTGRQIMQWIGEVCCRFCRATANGEIEFAWYTPAGVSITPSGEHYYLHKGLSYEEYQVEPVDAVQVRLAGNEDGFPWPEVAEGSNSYIITGNPLLRARVSTVLPSFLRAIQRELPTGRYTPCKVSIPATLDIHAGNTVEITDINGKTFTTYVMTKTQTGQKDTLECVGSPRRDSASAQSSQQKQQESTLNSAMQYTDKQQEATLDSAIQYSDKEIRKLNQEELLKRLTNEWVDDGLYLDENGKLAIRASVILLGGLFAENIYMTGTFEAESEAFMPPGWAEFQRAYDALIGAVDLSDEELPLYDLDGDGELTMTDVQTIYQAMIGNVDLSSWEGAKTSTVRVIIDPSNPSKAMRMVGTNMWGRQVEIFFGQQALFNGPDMEKNFDVVLSRSDSFEKLSARVAELESKLAGE